MNRKKFKFWTTTWAGIWAMFTAIAFWNGESLGTVATLGGIALMFAWLYEQVNLTK